jgi:indole-3-glycerol phosphate synthase
LILDKIVSDNLPYLEKRKQQLPLEKLKESVASMDFSPLDMEAILRGDRLNLIAEVKKASPSKSIIRADFDPVSIALTYAQSGAAAISVLTENLHFMGKLDYLIDIREALENKKIPLLRKDFIHDPYQVYESRFYGADAVLLIVAILTSEQLSELLKISHRLGMKCLVEVHNEKELEVALGSEARIIGINNRDLNTFQVDLSVTERLRSHIPSDRIVVSESGIHSKTDIARLQKLGVNAVLIGEALMSAPDIPAKIKELLD